MAKENRYITLALMIKKYCPSSMCFDETKNLRNFWRCISTVFVDDTFAGKCMIQVVKLDTFWRVRISRFPTKHYYMEKNCQVELYFDCVLISTHEVSIFLSTYTLSAASSSKQRIFSCLLSMLHLCKYLSVLSYLKILSIYVTYLGKHFNMLKKSFCPFT